MGRPRAPEATTTNDDPVFPLFNDLPWELRHMIWERALPLPIPQVMVYKPTTFPKWDAEMNTWNAIDGPPTVPMPPPTLLHTTQESRAFALKHVLVREVEEAPTRFPAPSAYHRIVSRPFNRDTDAMLIHDRYFDDFVEMYKSTLPEAARHLIFDPICFMIRRHYAPTRWYEWHDFISVADGSRRGLRSITLTWAGYMDGRLREGAWRDQDVRSCYRAVPESKELSWEKELCKRLAADFESLHVPDGVPWKVRVGSGVPYGADDGEDQERVLECSQIDIERFTASTMYRG